MSFRSRGRGTAAPPRKGRLGKQHHPQGEREEANNTHRKEGEKNTTQEGENNGKQHPSQEQEKRENNTTQKEDHITFKKPHRSSL